MTHATRSIIGLFGKLPSYGDFLTRDLPSQFVDAWDTWLQGYVRGSQEQLGEHWLDIYLTSPVWKFTLGRGVIDNNIWLGLMLPSVDRVGRYFPFSVACSVDTTLPITVISAQAESWFAEIEHIVLNALEAHIELDDLLTELNAIPLNIVGSHQGYPLEPSTHGAVIPSGHSTLNTNDLFPYLLDSTLQQLHTSYSLWQTHGSEYVAPCLFASKALPPVSGIGAMLDGGWQESHWAMPFELRADEPDTHPVANSVNQQVNNPVTHQAANQLTNQEISQAHTSGIYASSNPIDNFAVDFTQTQPVPVASRGTAKQTATTTHAAVVADELPVDSKNQPTVSTLPTDHDLPFSNQQDSNIYIPDNFLDDEDWPKATDTQDTPEHNSSNTAQSNDDLTENALIGHSPDINGADETEAELHTDPFFAETTERATEEMAEDSPNREEPIEDFMISGVDASRIEIEEDDPFGLASDMDLANTKHD